MSSEVWRELFLIPLKECLLVMFGVSIWRIIQHFSHKHDEMLCCPLCLSQCQGINQSAGDIMITRLQLYDRILSVHVAELLLWNTTNIFSGQAYFTGKRGKKGNIFHESHGATRANCTMLTDNEIKNNPILTGVGCRHFHFSHLPGLTLPRQVQPSSLDDFCYSMPGLENFTPQYLEIKYTY